MSESYPPLELRARAVGPWPMNTYVLRCPSTGAGVLIDPGAEPDTLSDMLADTEPVAILLTHTHPDHVGELAEMRRRLGVPVLAHPGPHFEGLDLDQDQGLADGDLVPVGRHALRVVHAPGHLPDLICLELEGDHHVIVGDTVFDGGPGKTWSSADFATTLDTLRRVVLPWPDATVCHPGHGPAFRLGDRRAVIEAFVDRDHGDFFGDATWAMGT